MGRRTECWMQPHRPVWSRGALSIERGTASRSSGEKRTETIRNSSSLRLVWSPLPFSPARLSLAHPPVAEFIRQQSQCEPLLRQDERRSRRATSRQQEERAGRGTQRCGHDRCDRLTASSRRHFATSASPDTQAEKLSTKRQIDYLSNSASPIVQQGSASDRPVLPLPHCRCLLLTVL